MDEIGKQAQTLAQQITHYVYPIFKRETLNKPAYDTKGVYTTPDSSLGTNAYRLTERGMEIQKKCQKAWTKLYHLGAVEMPEFQMYLATKYKSPFTEMGASACYRALFRLQTGAFTEDDEDNWRLQREDLAESAD